VFSYDNALIPDGDNYYRIFRISAPGLEFPISKNDLMEFSQNHRQEEDFGILLDPMQRLPKANKVYRNVEELEEDVMMIFNQDMKNKRIHQRITKCLIFNDKNISLSRVFDKNRKTVIQHLEEQRVKRKSREDNAPALARNNEGIYRLWLPGLEFPINENNLTKFALRDNEGDGEILLNFLQELPRPNETYRSKEELEHDLITAISKYVWKIKPSKKVMAVGCIIAVDKDWDKAREHLRVEKIKRVKKIRTLGQSKK
jgi:hypothetical protein